MKIVRRVLALLAVCFLMAILVYLYFKTQAIDIGKQNEIVLHLRELKQLDAQWNVDILKSRMGINKNYDPITDPLPRLRVVQERLESESKAYQGRALEEGIIHVGKAFAEKIELVEKFKSENSILRNSLQYLPTGTENFKEIIRDQQVSHGSQSGQFDLLEIRMNDVLTGILKFNLLPDAAAAERVMSQIEALEGIRTSYPATLAGPMATLLNHARVVLRQRTVEDALLKKMTSVATAERVEDLTNSFGLEFHAALNEKQQYRTYLVAYSMLLLLLLGYAGWRLMKSYRVIAEINKELQVSNQTLERRVEERTAELSKALENLKQSESQLIQSEKMASLGQMIAGVAHEINTPLAYVRSSLETVGGHLTSFVADVITESGKMMRLLKLDEIADKRVKDQFVKARELSTQFSEQQVLEELAGLVKDGVYGVDQISELVLNLKNFARLDRGKVAKFDLHEGLKNTLVIAKHIVKTKTIKLQFKNIPSITCSPSQINQVFLNLITNAAHATPDEGGVIHLVTGMHQNDQVKIEVIDNGCGIPKEVLPKIFDPFFTTKEVGKGTGLGLAIAYKIIREHGGTIEVSSRVGAGTKATVLLPVNLKSELAIAA